MTCNIDWWGHPDYPARTAWLATLNPPEPATFTEGALSHPWDLSNEQARFIVDHRYDRIPQT
jgi:hypothetical protein